jgi:uncharacterized alpha-E superfamily protein
MTIFSTPGIPPDSTLGCAGLMDAYRAGHVTICNAVGTGVADDKSIYPYVPKMIEFYLGEKPILNNVPTYMCRNPDDLAYTLANLKDLVVKEVHGAGGYGMLVGPAATKAELEDFGKAVQGQPQRLHRPADAEPVELPDLCRKRHCAAPHRPATRMCCRQDGADGARRPDPGGAQGGLAGGQLLAGRRHQGHLGARSMKNNMLSRTADHLFWMNRYTERAENTARLLDVNYQTSLLPQSEAVALAGWQGLLSISELLPSYRDKHGDIRAKEVMDFMVKDESNPSSILSCLGAARENARAVRGALTTEVWETQNQTWLEVKRMIKNGEFEQDPAQFFEWVKFRSHLSRGVTVGTMLMDEALHFMRLGTFLERADNTARLVDVKFHAVESDFYGAANEKDQEYDFYHWSAILRSVSGFEVYRKVYRDVIRPERVAELLILRPDMPRSLHASLNEVVSNLRMVASDEDSDTLRHAGRLRADLQFARIDEILATGLHAFLTQFLDRVNGLGGRISRDFLVPAVG